VIYDDLVELILRAARYPLRSLVSQQMKVRFEGSNPASLRDFMQLDLWQPSLASLLEARYPPPPMYEQMKARYMSQSMTSQDLHDIRVLHPKVATLRAKVMNAACEAGCLSNIDWLLKSGFEATVSSYGHAADLETCIFLMKNGVEMGEESFAAAASHGRVDTMTLLASLGCPYNVPMCIGHASTPEVMDWVESNSAGALDEDTLDRAALEAYVAGNVFAAWWIIDRLQDRLRDDFKWLGRDFMQIMVSAGTIDDMDRLMGMGFTNDLNEIFGEAAATGDVKKMQWLMDKGCRRPDDDIFDSAVEGSGTVETMEWLKAQGCRPQSLWFPLFRDSDDLTVFAWLVRNGCTFRRWRPDVPFMERLDAQGFLTEIFDRFFRSYDVPVYDWLAARGLRPPFHTWSRILLYSDYEMDVEKEMKLLDCLMNHGFCDMSASYTIIMALCWYESKCCDDQTLSVLKRLKAYGCPFPPSSDLVGEMFRGYVRDKPKTKKWLQQNVPHKVAKTFSEKVMERLFS
jgi:hypothetical protein